MPWGGHRSEFTIDQPACIVYHMKLTYGDSPPNFITIEHYQDTKWTPTSGVKYSINAVRL